MAALTLHWKPIERRGNKALEVNRVPAAEDISHRVTVLFRALNILQKDSPLLYIREILKHK